MHEPVKVTIVGTGYVGLVTGVCLARVGHQVTCVDIIPARVESINAGTSPIFEPGLDELLTKVLGWGRFRATTDLAAAVQDSELTMIAVGTPARDGQIDLTQIEAAARDVGRALKTTRDYHVVAVKSTVVPGTTDGLVRQAIEAESGRQAGEFGLCMNPEFLREADAIEDFMRPDRVVIGQLDFASGQVMSRLYAPFDCPKIHTGLRNAELIKYTANSLLATLVSFSNEIAGLCERTEGADANLVFDGLCLDKRLAPVLDGVRVSPGIVTYLRPGCGYGGSCLPKDVDALRAYADGVGAEVPLLDSVVAINKRRPDEVIDLARQALGNLSGATVAVLGLAFKPGTDDLRDSPALKLITRLGAEGAKLRAHDPVVEALDAAVTGVRTDIFPTPLEALAGADIAVIASACPEYKRLDWASAAEAMNNPIVVDGRNLLRGVALPPTLAYHPIGKGTTTGSPDHGRPRWADAAATGG